MNRLLFLLLLITNTVYAQNGVYFDKKGKASSQAEGYYVRTNVSGTNYKSTYINGETIYFEGQITQASSTDETQNKYVGKCRWYFKNGKVKFEKNFTDQGIEEGTSFYYYESGKTWKEIEYVKGAIKNNKYVEYTEDGRKSLLSEDSFNTNFNDWDLYTSDLSSAKLTNGTFELVSFTKAGTSRYISFANNSTDITIEASFDVSKADATQKTGFLFGFKDWNNYNYFLVSKDGIYVGYVFEGISAQKTDGMFVSNFDNEKKNSLKIITYDDQIVFSVNGEVQYKCDKLPMPGSNIGFALSGKGSVIIDDLIVKEINFNADNTTIVNKDDAGIKASGSGILIAENGYIITNEHVIHDANKIQVELITNGIATTYLATLVQKDEANDLAVIKITDDKFKPLDKLKYSFKESGAIEVSAPLFTIGFPLALSGMGKEVKYTDGKASAKTGYNGALNQFQTSIPVQPGNSGGPVFTDKGELLGVICSKITQADNVSYAVKLNYVKNLIETVSEITTLPNDKSVQALTSEERIKILSNYVTLIKIK